MGLTGFAGESFPASAFPPALGINSRETGAYTRTGDSEGFAGAMDEVWIGPAAHSPEWMRISYENQKPGSRFARLRVP